MKRKTKDAEPAAPQDTARPRITVTCRAGGSRVIPAPESAAAPPDESTLAPHLADAGPEESTGDH